MPRLAGVTIPDNKHIVVALTYIYGIGRSRSEEILRRVRVNPATRADALSPDEINKIRDIIEKEFRVEGDLRRQIGMHIRRLRDIGSWRGMRHSKRLPVRGQRTRTNNRTIRGNVRKTVGSGRKPAATPT